MRSENSAGNACHAPVEHWPADGGKDNEMKPKKPAGKPFAGKDNELAPFARRAATRKFVGERYTVEAQASAMAILYRKALACR